MNTKTRVFNLKEKVLYAIGQLPDTATGYEIIEEILLLRSVQQGLEDMEAGRSISHEEMKERMMKWGK